MDETPTEWATWSPKERDIASPGTYWLDHTLNGPVWFPIWSLKASILPPECTILSASSYILGLWSREYGINAHFLSSLVILIALESPKLLQ